MEDIKIGSESEQMYLVTIARLSEMVDECPIPISKVAEVLDITPISANQMVHHLVKMGLLVYTPYKGVEFTDAGWQTGIKLLRARRLWEVFLAEHLRYGPDDAEKLACKLEHAVSIETTDRLAAFLDWPRVSPKGKPIPQDGMEETVHTGVLLSSLSAGTAGIVSDIHAGKAEMGFLQQAGIRPGCHIEIVASQDEKAYLIKCEDEVPVNLNKELAQKILVKPQL